eukprot:g33815.t1
MLPAHVLSVEFRLPERPVYLSLAGRSPLPASSVAVGLRALVARQTTPWQMGTGHDTAVRTHFARLIGANSTDIALAPACSSALSAVASYLATILATRAAYDIPSSALSLPSISLPNTNARGPLHGKKVLILQGQFSSNVYCWQDFCRKTGAGLFVVAAPALRYKDGSGGATEEKHVISAGTERSVRKARTWTEAVLGVNWKKEGIVVAAIPNVLWCDGSYLDLQRVRDRCDQVEAYLVVDATQSVGVLETDVTKIRPDFLACSVHKWLLGAYGTCLLYVAPQHQSLLQPIDHHEHNRLGSDEADGLPFRTAASVETEGHVGWPERDADGIPYQYDAHGTLLPYREAFFPGAIRTDFGGRPNPVLLPLLANSLSLVLQWGPAVIHDYLSVLTQIIEETALSLGYGVPHERRGHILGIYPSPCRHPFSAEQLVHALQEEGFVVAARFGAVRIAPYVFNSHAQASLFCCALVEVSQRLFAQKPPPSTGAAVLPHTPSSLSSKL